MVFFIASLTITLLIGQSAPAQNALRIVVIEGEDAVNVIQHKTAVAPVVEIRDRNNIPVAGASVTFSIGGNSATFAGGAQTFTVATNAAGRAAVAALNPVSSGAVQIQVSAAFQGQTALATIAQTNVLTAAEAAAAASGASGASGAAGAGGGLSGTTIGIVGAAVAGGAVAATQAAGGESGGTTTTTSTSSQPRIFRGDFASTILLTFQGCTRNESWAGTLEITLTSTAPLAGNARILNGTTRVLSVTCTGGPQAGVTGNLPMPSTPVTGTAANMEFTWEASNPFGGPGTGEAPGINTNGHKFTGALNGSEITGTLQHSRRIEGSTSSVPGTGSASVAVTLR